MKRNVNNLLQVPCFRLSFLIRLLYSPAGTTGGYFGFSSVTPPQSPPRPPPPRHILVCALTAAFLDGFLSKFVWRYILVKSTRLLFLVMLPPGIPSLIGSKVIFWWNVVCALQATFLDGFLSNFVQMCIIVKSKHL